MARTKVLRVAAKREGFRRAGFVFGTVARDIPVGSLSAAARLAIESDPTLVVAVVETEAQTEVAEAAAPEAKAAALAESVEAPAVSTPARKRK